MDLTTLVTIIRRRWFVAAPLVAVGLVAAALVGGSPTYTVEANFLLVAPAVGADGTPSNALLENSSGVSAVASVAVVVLESEASRADVADAGYSADYDFRIARNEPFVTLLAEAGNADLAVGSTLALARLFIEEVADQQIRFGVASGSLVRAELLDVDEPAADYSGVRLRQALALTAGLVLAVLGAVAAEGWSFYRRGRLIGGVGTGMVGAGSATEGPLDPPPGAETDQEVVTEALDVESDDDGSPTEIEGTGGRGWRRRPARVPDGADDESDDDPLT